MLVMMSHSLEWGGGGGGRGFLDLITHLLLDYFFTSLLFGADLVSEAKYTGDTYI